MATQPLEFVPATPDSPATSSHAPAVEAERTLVDPQFSYREHVTGSLAAHPAEAPLFQPAYPPYSQPGYQPMYQQPPYPGYPVGYAPYAGHLAYPGYPPYAWQPPRPKRDAYLLTIDILSLIGSILVLLVGLGFTFVGLLLAIFPMNIMKSNELFSGDVLLVSIICTGVFGGSFGLYHSIRALMRKPSAAFELPWFWTFLVLYLAVIGIGFWLHSQGQDLAFPLLSIVLILLAGLFPALAVLALGVRRLRIRAAKPQKATWPATWRRVTLALLSGATLSVMLAYILETALLAVLVLLTHTPGMQNLASCVNTPAAPSCQNPAAYGLILLTLAVVAPLVEETVKPLAVVVLIGRVRSAVEAFALGLACGIGFDLVETSAYISLGYRDWLNVALLRTGAGLLHGFGAAIVALGWYYLVHAKELGYGKAFLRAFACWLYAVLQHAIWNGSVSLALLPAPIGPFFQQAVNLGFTSLPSFIIVNIVEVLFMLAFFVYLTGRLRTKSASPPSPTLASGKHKVETSPGQPVGALM